ncbi:MAG TPA: rod shape-determining protein MreD [Steroidobacteraceae bacterium]|nr:rod shape-determining protein MreD [Steroidobacteraceae bacterium]
MMLAGSRDSPLLVYLTALIALMLTLAPLPRTVGLLWPNLLVLVVIYWSLMMPRTGGILIGFLGGLAIDVFVGSQLGQHALALSLLCYLAIRLHLLIRAKPLFEQALFVLAALLIYEAVLWAIDGFSNQSTGTWTRWLHAFTGAAIWPLVAGLLGRMHSPR